MRILTPWTQQPQIATEIDWSNLITRGIRFVLLGDRLLFNTGFSSASRVGRHGIGSYVPSPSGSNNPIVTTGQTGITGTDYSLFAFGSMPNASAFCSAIDDDVDNGGTRSFQFRMYQGKVQLITFDTSQNPYFATAATAITDTQAVSGFAIGASVKGNAIAVYQNGVKASGTASNTQSVPTGDLFIGQHKGVGGTGWQGALYLATGWSRTLSDSEQNSLSDNPWQIFKPIPRRIFVPVGASSSGMLYPSLYTNDQTYYAPTVSQSGGNQTLTPSLFTNDPAYYTHTLSATKTLTPSLYTNDQSFYAHTLSASKTLTPSLFTNDQSFYAHTLSASKTLTPSLFTNDPSYYTHALSASKTLTPSLYTNAQDFYGPTLSATVNLAPTLHTNGSTFFTQTVSVGTVTLTPALFTNDQSYYSHVLNQAGGPQNVAPNLYTNSNTFYSHALAPGAVSLAPSLYSNDQTFYSLTLTTTKTLTASLHTNDQSFFGPVVTQDGGLQYVIPSLFENTQSYFSHTVTTGQVQLYPVLLDNAQSFYAHTVSQGALPTIARPNSDISNTGWMPSTGSDLYAMLDEVTPDDADYISTNIVGSAVVFGLNATQWPGSASQQLSLRASSSTGNGILVTIKDGATTIATRTLTLTPTFDLHTITLTSGEIAAITSGNLTVEMTST